MDGVEFNRKKATATPGTLAINDTSEHDDLMSTLPPCTKSNTKVTEAG
jgi:hypothetical protein